MPADHALTLRVLTSTDLDQLAELTEIVFNSEPYSDEERKIDEELHELDSGRAVGVFDGDELAGVGTVTTFELTVPGGVLPMLGVLLIGVKSTHRRRGVMSRIIRHQLHTVHEEGGEPLAGLTASESVIYGRFGYGQAAYSAFFTVPRHRAALRPVAGIDDVRIRIVPTADSVEVCEGIHARQVGKRPGMMARPEAWARVYAADLDRWRGGRSALRTVLAERGGDAVGYARYRTKDDWDAGVPKGSTDVSEIHADDVAAFAALVRYLTDIDLTTATGFMKQPVDSPLVYLLADLRAAQMRIRESLYLRVVDVDRALAGRRYADPVDLVLELTDELCPWNAGRWRLTGDEKTAECVRTDAAADLSLDVRELAAVYLGGTTLAALEQAGLVTGLRPGAVAVASRAFATQLAPWLQYGI
jgi:predicted acetyltransferase